MSKKIVIYVNTYGTVFGDTYFTKTYLLDENKTVEVDTGLVSNSYLPLLNTTVEVEDSFILSEKSAKNILRDIVKNK